MSCSLAVALLHGHRQRVQLMPQVLKALVQALAPLNA